VPQPDQPGTGEQAKLPALGGEIGKTRGELNAVRTRGLQKIGIKIGVIPWPRPAPRFIMALLRGSAATRRAPVDGSAVVRS
jgi:hypothetical protein